MSAYMAAQRTKGLSPDTVDYCDTHVRHVARVLGEDTQLSRVTARSVDSYLLKRASEGAAQNTRCKELITFRAAMALARRRGEFPLSVDEVFPKLASGYVPLERRLNEAELGRLLEHLTPPRAAVCAFIVASAADWSSVALARREDFDLLRSRVFVRGTKNTHRRREVPVVLPLFSRLLHLAAAHLPFAPWGNAVRDLAVACRQADVPRVTPRDLRRTHGYILRSHGVEPHLIARSMGHATSAMVERVYGKLPTDAFENLLVARLGTQTAQRKAPKRTRRAKKAGSRG